MLTIFALSAIFPIVNPRLILAARDLGPSPGHIVRMVLLPSAVPSIFAGVWLGLGIERRRWAKTGRIMWTNDQKLQGRHVRLQPCQRITRSSLLVALWAASLR
jgi:hypothetical protein